MRTAAAFAASALALLGGATNVRAQEFGLPSSPLSQSGAADFAPGRAASAGRPKSRFYLGGGGGVVFGRYSDPKLINDNFSGVTTEVHIGVAMTRWLGAGLEFATFYDEVTRTVAGRYSYDEGARSSALGAGLGTRRLAAECTSCGPLPSGGAIVQQALHLHTFGPRIDFAPDPSRGIYAVLNSGLSVTQDLTDRTGFMLGLRGGYRFALSEQVGLALEGGTSAQRYSNSFATFGFGGVGLQLRL